MQTLSIGVVIPTFQAAKHLPNCLPPLIHSSLKPRILIIDSSSSDETVQIAKAMGVETLIIPQSEFNHGLTREKGRHYLGTDIVVMITQDAYATTPDMLERLIRPLIHQQASISYARQLPHHGASIFAAFARQFNYPPTSHIRSLKDLSTFGVYTFFCSNSCAAYLNRALDEVGGFPPVLFGEDTIVVARLLHNHHHIAYVAEAEVRHSHDYTLKQEFCRHFDIGLSRHTYHSLLAVSGKDTKRGKTYVRKLFKELIDKQPALLPYAFLQSIAKFLGYRLGQVSLHAPIWFKKACSSQKFYWKN
jgi:rhamnosyltransferase